MQEGGAGETGRMARCIILTPLYAGEALSWVSPRAGDFLICADGGWARATAYHLPVDLVVGDFDSMPPKMRPDVLTLTLPVEKDDTDLVVCLHEGRKRGYTEFILAGAIGGRFDHTLSCLQCAADCALRGERAWLLNAQNCATILPPGTYTLPKAPGLKLSLLAYSPQVTGVTLTGTKWTLDNATLTARYPLGCSNEFAADAATLTFREGLLIACYSMDLTFVEN